MKYLVLRNLIVGKNIELLKNTVVDGEFLNKLSVDPLPLLNQSLIKLIENEESNEIKVEKMAEKEEKEVEESNEGMERQAQPKLKSKKKK